MPSILETMAIALNKQGGKAPPLLAKDSPKPKAAPQAVPSLVVTPQKNSDGKSPAVSSEKKGGKSRGERNNNPGNLEYGKFAKSMGATGTDGRFAIFPTREAGEKAQVTLLQKNYKNMSVAEVIRKYAPAGDNSSASMRNYIGYVAGKLGLNPDAKVPAEQYAKMATHMREFETGNHSGKINAYGGSTGGAASGSMNADRSGIGVADPAKFLEGLESQLGPEAKASAGVKQNSSATFGSDAELSTRADNVEQQLVKQGEAVDVLDTVTQAAQVAATNAMASQVQQTKDISNEIVGATNELKKKVEPIFKMRGRVADQLDKLATMNPLERGIKGIFDLDYDKDYLEGQLQALDTTLKMRSDDYDYMNKLHGAAMTEIGRRYELDTAMPNLLKEQSSEDLGLVGMRIQQTSGMLGSLRDRISTESQLIAAKAVARTDLLGRLDLPTITELMTTAEQSEGVVQYNGVEFSYTELREIGRAHV